jgi:hypothetical protein
MLKDQAHLFAFTLVPMDTGLNLFRCNSVSSCSLPVLQVGYSQSSRIYDTNSWRVFQKSQLWYEVLKVGCLMQRFYALVFINGLQVLCIRKPDSFSLVVLHIRYHAWDWNGHCREVRRKWCQIVNGKELFTIYVCDYWKSGYVILGR